jgi:ubiquinone/menaquinone biosynthesis C-methylase UbiE
VKVVELDFSRKMLAINIAKHGGETIEYRCEAIESTSLEAESFDAILCFNALPHFKIGKALPRIAELLSAGGRIAVGHLMSSDELNVFHSSVQGPVAHDKLPAAEDLSSMLLGVGLLVIHSEEWSGWYFVLAEKPALAKHNAQSK